ncbi:MAG: DUF4276 family protein [Prosthecochloris sp.]|nr:DUF4276 family protein [Prosthecochloris sp.]
MTIELILEEPSAEAAMRLIMPKILAGRAEVNYINMRNKSRLLQELPARLRGYKEQIRSGADIRIVVLIDRDSDDCEALKSRLEQMAYEAGLATRSRPLENGQFFVVNRIAVEELEAWFIGDPEALRAAFTSLRRVEIPKSFKNPDTNGTWEQLHRFLKKQGIYRGHYPKIEAAKSIARHMDVSRNASRSFQQFVKGVKVLAQG